MVLVALRHVTPSMTKDHAFAFWHAGKVIFISDCVVAKWNLLAGRIVCVCMVNMWYEVTDIIMCCMQV